MKFVIIFAMTLVAVSVVAGNQIKPRNIVVPAGRPEGRISKGSYATLGQFPYQVGLLLKRSDKNTFCGGALISNTRVLTVAHCTENVFGAQVLLGTISSQNGAVVYDVIYSDIIIHPGWQPKTFENDISLIRIPYTYYTANIMPIALPYGDNAHTSYAGETAVVSGWGQLSDADKVIFTDLQFAKMNIVSSSVCSRVYKITYNDICISTDNGVSTCNGDSGGPLVLERSKVLVGLVSFGDKSGCQKFYPIALTHVASYLHWIQQHSD